ncbi:MAG: hypothetical protein LBU65_16165 [Planctomycetaceae bacterium]|jgi:hypothetical protein|nr:hypothetical protein [Planctomycetaceae bacterium]
MESDTAIKCEGMKLLRDHLGIVESERFVTLMLRDSFDYTEWQRDLYKDVSVVDLYNKIKMREIESEQGESNNKTE